MTTDDPKDAGDVDTRELTLFGAWREWAPSKLVAELIEMTTAWDRAVDWYGEKLIWSVKGALPYHERLQQLIALRDTWLRDQYRSGALIFEGIDTSDGRAAHYSKAPWSHEIADLIGFDVNENALLLQGWNGKLRNLKVRQRSGAAPVSTAELGGPAATSSRDHSKDCAAPKFHAYNYLSRKFETGERQNKEKCFLEVKEKIPNLSRRDYDRVWEKLRSRFLDIGKPGRRSSAKIKEGDAESPP